MTTEKVFNYMGVAKVASLVSLLLVLGSIASLFINGLNFGLDFTGGTVLELHYEHEADIEAIREQLNDEGFPSAVVTNFGSDRDVLIRIQTDDAKLGDQLAEKLQTATPDENVELKRMSYVGPQVGEELRDDGGLGMLFALAVVMFYVAVRFQFKFSVGAVVGLAHDVILILGLFSVLQLDFDLTVLAAILAVIGYSINDTIVVFDRIRENFRVVRKGSSEEIINLSVRQTLDRTMITSLTTLLVLIALYFVGGDLIHNFAIALIFGIVVGTYSSIFMASRLLLLMNVSKDDLREVEKEGADQDEIVL